VTAHAPLPIDFRPGTPTRNGFTESGSERLVRDFLELAAVFTGCRTAMLLHDEAGIWYRDGSGLAVEQLAVLGTALAQGVTPGSRSILAQKLGLQVIAALPLLDVYRRPIGTLLALSPEPIRLAADQGEGLRRVADQLQALLTAERQKRELRATPRAPSAASFVPGLVHELHNFAFGISANLDAFEARFAGQEDVRRYGATIRKAVDRLSAFIDELKEYGDPQEVSWTEGAIGPLLRDILEDLKPLSQRNGVEVRFHVSDSLPSLCMDEHSLRGAFVQLIRLLIEQEVDGGSVAIHVDSLLHGERTVLCGHLDGTCLKLKDVDLARLFEPFHFRKTGIGRLALPVARRIFESHGGNLTAGPGPEGGMRINFMLPAAMPDQVSPASRP